MASTVVIGGSSGIGRQLATSFAAQGDQVVISARTADKAAQVAQEIGGETRGVELDLAAPDTIEPALASVGVVDNLIITAIDQVTNSIGEFDLDAAVRAVTIKLVGYAEAVRVLRSRIAPPGSVVLFGGLAKDRPYPGSTMVTTINAGLTGLVRTLARELAPLRINAIHPGIVGDSPKWRDVPDHPAIARTPLGRLVTMNEVEHAVRFLLENTGVNAIDLPIDGGWVIT